MSHIIGVLAGMGPRSTTPFLELLLDQCQLQYGAKFDIDYPEILIYSLPTPFYIGQELDHKEMERTISEGLKKLESWGVDFIAMPCNSAHVYFRELAAAIRIPLLNIVEEAIRDLPKEQNKVTIFATESTMKAGLYQDGIVKANHEFVFLEGWQKKLNGIIQRIKMKEDLKAITTEWEALLTEVNEHEVDTVLVACTDLTVLFKNREYGVKIIDSAEALAKKTVREYLSLENKAVRNRSLE